MVYCKSPVTRAGVPEIAPLCSHRLVGLVVKASASRAADPGLDSRSRRVDFSISSHTSDSKFGSPVAIPCQAPGVIGSALG